MTTKSSIKDLRIYHVDVLRHLVDHGQCNSIQIFDEFYIFFKNATSAGFALGILRKHGFVIRHNVKKTRSAHNMWEITDEGREYLQTSSRKG